MARDEGDREGNRETQLNEGERGREGDRGRDVYRDGRRDRRREGGSYFQSLLPTIRSLR